MASLGWEGRAREQKSFIPSQRTKVRLLGRFNIFFSLVIAINLGVQLLAMLDKHKRG